MLPAVLLLLASLDVPTPLEDALPVDAGVAVVDAGVAEADAGVEAPLAAAPEEEAAEPDGELEAMRALEEVTLDPGARSDAALRAAVTRLGLGSLTRDRLENALEAAALSGEALTFALDPVTDLATFDVAKVKDRFDIPVEMQPLVAQYIHFFQKGGRKWFRRWMSRSARYIPLMQPILEARGLPRDTVYLAMIESGFNTQAKSWARAVGPWQFIAGTAKMFKLREDFWVDERKDPIKATHAAASYLSRLHGELGHWYLAWAGYNTGGGRMRRMVDTHGTTDFWALSEKKGLARETKHYVPKLIACALVAKHPEAFGFSPEEFEPEPPFEFDEVALTDAVDLEVIAQAAGVPLEAVQELNPELKRWCTPPASPEEPYRLRIPRGRAEAFAANYAQLAPSERLHFKVHRVAKGDTLSKIALTYRSAQEAILRMNHLTNARALKLGADLIVPVPSAKAGAVDAALEKQVVRARRSGLRALRPEDEVPAGSQTAASGKVAVGGTMKLTTEGGKQKVVYTIGRGDSLWSIARRFDLHVAELKEWNPSLGSPRGLKVGATVTLWPGPGADLSAPAPASAAAPASTPKATVKAAARGGAKHTVGRGDSLWSISRRYGCSVEELKAWNGLGSAALQRGQVLVVAQ